MDMSTYRQQATPDELRAHLWTLHMDLRAAYDLDVRDQIKGKIKAVEAELDQKESAA